MKHINKIYIIAGEASGDLHGGNLCKELKKLDPRLEIRGWGGDNMRSSGVHIEVPYEQVNFMGFTEVIKNLGKIMKLFRETKKSILQFKPDALILIDYPGFNLRMAKWANSNDIPVYYYIAPQVWAWKEKRVLAIKNYVQRLFVILPFEKSFFAKHKIEVSYHGHPLVQLIDSFKFNRNFRVNNDLDSKSILAILPGSRKQEIKKMLPIYLEATKDSCKYQVIIAGLKQHKALYHQIIQSANCNVKLILDDTYNLLHQARYAIVTSGTASLETALFGVPEMVCYKGNQFSYWLAKKLIKVRFISLVNLIANKKIVQELIQHECNPDAIREELRRIQQVIVRKRILFKLGELKNMLAGSDPYANVAKEILENFNMLQR